MLGDFVNNNFKEKINKPTSKGSSSHLCKHCLRTFKDVNNYKEHCFQEHRINGISEKVRKCSMCSYATLLKSKYDCHMRCHLNNQVIRCAQCDYSTINIRHMSRHERMHMMLLDSAVNRNGNGKGNITTNKSSCLPRKIDNDNDDDEDEEEEEAMNNNSSSMSSAAAALKRKLTRCCRTMAPDVKYQISGGGVNKILGTTAIDLSKKRKHKIESDGDCGMIMTAATKSVPPPSTSSTSLSSSPISSIDEYNGRGSCSSKINNNNNNTEYCCVHKSQLDMLQQKFLKMLLLISPQFYLAGTSNSTTATATATTTTTTASSYAYASTNEIIDYLIRVFELNSSNLI